MHVAICVVGFRNTDDIVQCLSAVAASTHSDFEVVICENGGPEAYAALRRQIDERLTAGQKVSILSAPDNPGYAGGVNACIRAAANADAWWILNPDTKPHPQALARMVERLERGDCDAVGSVLHWSDGTVQSYGGRWRPWLARAVAIGMGQSLSDPVDQAAVESQLSYLSGASLLAGRRFLDRLGPMREEYFLYCEEVEWCIRARQEGLRLGFAPQALVEHGHGTTTGSGESVARRPKLPVYLDERNKMLVTRDRYPALIMPAALGALAMMGLRYGRRGAWRQFGFALSGWFAGLRNRRGKPEWLLR